MTRLRSSWPRIVRDPRDRADAELVVADLWRSNGIAVFWPDQLSDDWERATVSNIATRLYGRRT